MYHQQKRISKPYQNSNQGCLNHQNFILRSPVIYSKKKLENINCIEQPSGQFGGLFLGDIISVMKPEIMKAHKITAILSCNAEIQNISSSAEFIQRKFIPAKDTLDYPINIHFQESYNFIEQMRRKNKNVLVHCHAGVSRSAALVCSYLMKKNIWTMNEALSYIKSRRQRIRPNKTFLSLLSIYEMQLNNLQKTIQLTDQNKSGYLYQSKIVFQGNPSQIRKPTSIIHRREQSSITISQNSKIQESPNIYTLIKSQLGNQSTKDRHKSFISDDHSFPKNRVSLKLGRKTRIPWHLAQQKQPLDSMKKKLFLEQKKEIKTTGCLF